MKTLKPNIQIPVDLTNPGQFFACCGLLELADRTVYTAKSRENCVSQTLELPEAFVESNQFKVGCFRKGSQVSVRPNVCRKRAQLCESSPCYFDIDWLFRKHDAIVVKQILVDSPSVDHRQRIKRISFLIRREPQKPQLSYSTKRAAIWPGRLHPSHCPSVMDMRIIRDCHPKVDARKVHSTFVSGPQCLPHRESPQMFGLNGRESDWLKSH